MTDAQDLILDKLVGSKIGVNWPDGPLALAASVLDGDEPIRFLNRYGDRGAKATIAKRLGFPVLLCEAIQGAVRGLKAEEDRRSFAMLVFRSVVVPGKPTRMSQTEQIHLAAEVAVRIHPMLCRADCPAVLALQQGLLTPPHNWVALSRYARVVCASARLPLSRGQFLTASDPPAVRLVQTVFQVLTALKNQKSANAWNSLRESARLMASERGVGEAAKLCVEIACRCGLAAETV